MGWPIIRTVSTHGDVDSDRTCYFPFQQVNDIFVLIFAINPTQDQQARVDPLTWEVSEVER